jgi:hypothetical protein
MAFTINGVVGGVFNGTRFSLPFPVGFARQFYPVFYLMVGAVVGGFTLWFYPVSDGMTMRLPNHTVGMKGSGFTVALATVHARLIRFGQTVAVVLPNRWLGTDTHV